VAWGKMWCVAHPHASAVNAYNGGTPQDHVYWIKWMLYVVCFMLHASCFMLHASCFMLHASCFTLWHFT
jgi:hypothetical protein